ncbi:DUF6461 domain-containing protein [Pseudactinotalea terrae]|uniref:DUF6461 domain-containing protein n=1 Tax=Pseudactinotalea terrae TaxID=1743262 RepID=UPI0012E31DE2|nr:DUF6461 domain-containing protein [Pseudactinotalea terrae]
MTYGAVAAAVALLAVACTGGGAADPERTGMSPSSADVSHSSEPDWAVDAFEAATITAIGGTSLDTVLAAFGAGGAPVLPSEHLDAPWTGGEQPAWAVIAPVGEGVIVVEPIGYVGTNPAVLEAASQGGTAVMVYWSVNYDTEVEIAVDGEVVAGIFGQPHGIERLPQLTEQIGAPPEDLVEQLRWGIEAQQELTGAWLTSELWAELEARPTAYSLTPPSSP